MTIETSNVDARFMRSPPIPAGGRLPAAGWT